MRRTATALLAGLALALSGCSAESQPDKPAPAASASKSSPPSLSAAEARQACVDAWQDELEQVPDGAEEPDTAPAECRGLPDQLDMQMEAYQAQNEEGQREMRDCLDDPECTEVPVG